MPPAWGVASTTAMAGTTETEQFAAAAPTPAARNDWVADGVDGAMLIHRRLPRHEDHDDGLVSGHVWVRSQR